MYHETISSPSFLFLLTQWEILNWLERSVAISRHEQRSAVLAFQKSLGINLFVDNFNIVDAALAPTYFTELGVCLDAEIGSSRASVNFSFLLFN